MPVDVEATNEKSKFWCVNTSIGVMSIVTIVGRPVSHQASVSRVQTDATSAVREGRSVGKERQEEIEEVRRRYVFFEVH